ncbi:hypothetical protein HKCCE2091_12635 [Rhodobacterales bacterium HKCCE2091]|nr:hypothetical protein [Rhodobacterales bacterium HKCCE2091]
MIRAALIGAALASPVAAAAQQGSAPEGPGPWDRPRLATILDFPLGYDDMADAGRFGTVAAPGQNELGLTLVLRMFANVCVGLEEGAPLAAVLPDGFAAYDQSDYLFGTATPATDSPYVLSPTGNIDADETGGHPTFWLRDSGTGMGCQLEWRFAPDDLPEAQRSTMAAVVREWLPYQMALVRASRPELSPSPPLFGLQEWDRPCGDRWCPMTAHYDMRDLYLTLDTKLDITAPEGPRP